MFHYLKQDAVLLDCFGRVRADVALIHIGQIDRVAAHVPHLFGQRNDLSAIALVGWCDLQRHQVAQSVDRDSDLRSLTPFGTVVVSAPPLPSVDCSVPLSRHTDVGIPLRPPSSHNRGRSSSNKTSNTSASTQRRIS